MEEEHTMPPEYSEKDNSQNAAMDDVEDTDEAPKPTEGWEEKKPDKTGIIIAALVRVLFFVIIGLSVWVLVSVKNVGSNSPEVWFAVLGGLALFTVDFVLLVKRKGREYTWGWSPAILIYVLVSGTALVLMVLEYRYYAGVGNAQMLASTLTLYGLDSTTLYVSFNELVQLNIGYVLLAAVIGQWMLGRDEPMFAESRFCILLISLTQAFDLVVFFSTLMTCATAADDVYTAIFLACAGVAMTQFSFDPAQNWNKPIPEYNSGSGCTKCLSNQFVRVSVPAFLHELPLLACRIIILIDAGNQFNSCTNPQIYFAVTKNAICFIYLFTWMMIACCRQCAGSGVSMENTKSSEHTGKKKRELSANRKRIKAAIKMRNRVGQQRGYM